MKFLGINLIKMSTTQPILRKLQNIADRNLKIHGNR